MISASAASASTAIVTTGTAIATVVLGGRVFRALLLCSGPGAAVCEPAAATASSGAVSLLCGGAPGRYDVSPAQSSVLVHSNSQHSARAKLKIRLALAALCAACTLQSAQNAQCWAHARMWPSIAQARSRTYTSCCSSHQLAQSSVPYR